MRWLPWLLSHAAAARRIPARITTSHGFASGGRVRGGAPSAVSEAVARPEEPKKRPDAAAKRSSRRPSVAAGAVVRSEEPKKRPDATTKRPRRRPAVADAVVRSEEPKKRRDAAAKRPRRRRAVSKGGGEVSLIGGFANAARSFMNSKVAALGAQMARAWWKAGKGDAPSTSCWRGEELDRTRLQASRILCLTELVHHV